MSVFRKVLLLFLAGIVLTGIIYTGEVNGQGEEYFVEILDVQQNIVPGITTRTGVDVIVTFRYNLPSVSPPDGFPHILVQVFEHRLNGSSNLIGHREEYDLPRKGTITADRVLYCYQAGPGCDSKFPADVDRLEIIVWGYGWLDGKQLKRLDQKFISLIPQANQPPVCSFTISPQNPTTKDRIDFDSTSYDPDGDPLTYSWYIDGQYLSEVGNSPGFYVESTPTPGQATITLEVKDPSGNTASCTQTVTVVATGLDVAVLMDSQNYAPGEIILIEVDAWDSETEDPVEGASVQLKVEGHQGVLSPRIDAPSGSSTGAFGEYLAYILLPQDIAEGMYTIHVTVSAAGYPQATQAVQFNVGQLGIQLEKNPETGEPFVGICADGVSTLNISISLPGCSDVKLSKPNIGELEGNAIDSTGNVKLDSSGVAEITYHPPDYLTKDQLTRDMNVHQQGTRVWAAEVPLTLTYMDASGNDAETEAEILVCRPPVMLVHGFCGSPATWGKMSNDLREEKFDTYQGDYRDDLYIEELSTFLKHDIYEQKVDYASSNIKIGKVDVVGHSMGGLIARYYTHDNTGYTNDVRKLIMVGAPNHGVNWSKKKAGEKVADSCGTHSKAAQQLYSESPFIKKINTGEKAGYHLNPDIQYGNIYGYPNDWVVSAASAYLNGVDDDLEFGVKHSAVMPGYMGVAIAEHKPVWGKVKTWLTSDIYKAQLISSHAEVYKYRGGVYLVDYDLSGNRHESKLESSPKEILQGLRTDKDSTAIVHLTIGAQPWGVIYLDPASEIFLGHHSPQLVEVYLNKGSAAFRSREDGHWTVPVNIERPEAGEWWRCCPQATVTGLDTEFAVVAGGKIEVHCLEGRLVVDTPDNTGDGTILSEGDSVAVEGETITKINPVTKDDFWWASEEDSFLGSAPSGTGPTTTQSTAASSVAQYDFNSNDFIDKEEAVEAVNDYLLQGMISKDLAIGVVTAYLLEQRLGTD